MRVANDPAKASIDIGYGDAVVPEGVEIEVPQMFDGGESLVMPAYSIEAFLAEKTETVVSGFPGNTLRRLKDFYDIATVADSWREPLDGSTLLESFRVTFERRKTAPEVEVFGDIRDLVVLNDKMEREWADFKDRAGVGDRDLELLAAIRRVEEFAAPVLAALAEEGGFEETWVPGSGWRGGPR